MHLLVSEQYIDSIMYGATIKVSWKTSRNMFSKSELHFFESR